MEKFLVTGVAGFIGFHLSNKLLQMGAEVIGIDNINDYYDVGLKHSRLTQLKNYHNFQFYKLDVSDRPSISELFTHHSPTKVIHLAAQAGVRYSITNPHTYVDTNLVGFINILEGCRHSQVKHLVFASSSSVYGANTKRPFTVHDNVDHPISLYAATKKANELMAHSYSHLYNLPTTGLRFFTAYGPWGRPDMALFLFTQAILQDQPINVFNEGKMQRNFTYVDDIIEAVTRVVDKIPQPTIDKTNFTLDPSTSFAPYRIYNVGSAKSVKLNYFIEVLENYLGKKAKKNLLPLQPGDIPEADADVQDLEQEFGFKPSTPVEVGIPKFVDWYRSYYGV
ncbi:NAD-dependent epimerase [Iningainema tapete]|uniref:NAD-dependent epimerase n=1 Tax=Iningainema tapete BLCC-T55 TaxID=2748662 RepID=A0A8J6XJE8_9CYAN|nr:NAD-dependent epimerase [Iningainema tapete]MBD2771876.1 NAD-dependent epimerase [Iningainema tapete BLCC-T55]